MRKLVLIAAVDKKFGIGKNNSIPWNIPEDMKFFKEKTIGNTVVMGNKTFKSMNEKPLKNRKNIVLTKDFLNKNMFTIKPENLSYENSFELLERTIFNILRHTEEDVYIIGGSSLYKYFINDCDEIYITYIDKDYECDTFCPKPSDNYLLVNKEYNQHYCEQEDVNYYFLHYKRKCMIHKNEKQYLDLLKFIINEGETKTDRTNIGTLSSFGHQMKFDISNRVPLLTTKRVPWKMVIEELLWFLRGDTDAKKLQEKNIHIWDGNTSREFLDNRDLTYEEGDLGPMYGWQLLHYGAEYDNCKTDYTGKGINQVERVLKMIKQEPNSRRILMTMYNPSDLEKGVLEPCHGIVIQFYVSEGKYLSCHMYQR